MNYKFVVDYYDIHNDEHSGEYLLPGMTLEEICRDLDFFPVNVIGKEVQIPIGVMKRWSSRFGFEYLPDRFIYSVSCYDANA